MKVASQTLSGIEISAFRFLIAAAFLLPWCFRIPRNTWFVGGWMGALLLASFVTQAWGLEYISSNRSAFITSLNVVMVPLLGWMLGRRPSWLVFVAACIAFWGIGLMSYEGESNRFADGLTFFSALSYAAYTLALSKFTHQHNARDLSCAQIMWMALMGLVWMLSVSGWERTVAIPFLLNGDLWIGLLYLGLVASAAMLFVQAIALRQLSADKAAIIYAMEPVFAALFAWWWLAETMTTQALIGAALVLLGVLLSELKIDLKWPARKSL